MTKAMCKALLTYLFWCEIIACAVCLACGRSVFPALFAAAFTACLSRMAENTEFA